MTDTQTIAHRLLTAFFKGEYHDTEVSVHGDRRLPTEYQEAISIEVSRDVVRRYDGL